MVICFDQAPVTPCSNGPLQMRYLVRILQRAEYLEGSVSWQELFPFVLVLGQNF